MKKGDGGKGFCKRWFVLKGNLLFYFEKKSDREPIGVIILEGSTVELSDSESEEHFCFKVIFPSKSYILGAESQSAMEQWMKSLACASYDYVKLMAAELQRQLDELCQNEAEQALEAASGVPTPPPRARVPKGPIKYPSQKKPRSFQSMHDDFGVKILKEQGTRWTPDDGGNGNQKTKESQPTLSLLQHEDVINF